MLRLNGFRAWISVDHKPLEAYNIEIDAHQNIATCWVPSTAGKAFSVTWQDLARVRTLATSGRVTADGVSCGGKVIPPIGVRKSSKARRSGIRTGPTSVRPFTFGKLDLTDDDRYLDKGPAHALGEITLSIHSVSIEGLTEPHARSVPTDDEGIVHERAKKATSHRVKWGDEVKYHRRCSTVVRDLARAPVVTFVFKYRPLDILKATGIVPKSAKRLPRRELKRPREDVVTSDDEVKSLVLEDNPRPRTRRLKRIKLERSLKRESPPIKREVIDLT